MRSTGLNPTDDELTKMIKRVDADKNGKLSFDEFQTLMYQEMRKDAIEQLRNIFSSYDKDNDGTVTVEEARIALKQQGYPDKDVEQSIKLMFKDTDFDRDDKLIFEG
jgi:calmodulin